MDERLNLVQLFRARQDSYKAAEVALASARVEDRLECIRGSIRFYRDPPPNRDLGVDFGRLVVERRLLSPEAAFLPIVESLGVEELRPDGGRPMATTHDFEGFRVKPSIASVERPGWLYHLAAGLPNAIGEPRYFGWPSQQFLLFPKNPQPWLDPPGPIGNSRLGVHPNPTKFINEFIEADYSRYPGASRAILVVLPDYRARFTEAVVGEGWIEAGFECGTFGTERLFFRAAIDEKELFTTPELRFDATKTKGVVKVHFSEAQSSPQLFLMDREGDDIVDWINLDTNSAYVSPEVRFETPRGQIARLVALGEGQTQEFKQTADTKTIVQAVVAFSNTQGGTIFVGVTDSGIPEKIDQVASRQSIEQAVRQNCEPIVQLGYENVELNGVPILLVRVPRGLNPPYQFRGNGVYYIRRGASNFPATPEELRQLMGPSTPFG